MYLYVSLYMHLLCNILYLAIVSAKVLSSYFILRLVILVVSFCLYCERIRLTKNDIVTLLFIDYKFNAACTITEISLVCFTINLDEAKWTVLIFLMEHVSKEISWYYQYAYFFPLTVMNHLFCFWITVDIKSRQGLPEMCSICIVGNYGTWRSQGLVRHSMSLAKLT